MSSAANNSIPSFEEMETKIQDEIIELIKVHLDEKSRIRFWEPNERIDDSIILATTPEILNIWAYVTFTSKKSRQNTIEVGFWRNFHNSCIAGGNLDYEIRASLKHFGRLAAKVVIDYFGSRNSLYVGKIRFDLIPTGEYGHYIIPNLVLSDNIFIYKTIIDANSSHNRYDENDVYRIPYEEYVQSRIEDYVALAEHKERLKQSQNHKESS